MAVADFLLRFRSLSTAALQAKQTALEAQDTIFQSQGMGTKTMTRDLRLLQDQLNAIAFVLKERGCVTIIPAVINHNIGVVDFSGVQ